MADEKQSQTAQPGKPAAPKSIPFKQMTGKQKLVFIGKVTLSVISFGFIYPNITSD